VRPIKYWRILMNGPDEYSLSGYTSSDIQLIFQPHATNWVYTVTYPTSIIGAFGACKFPSNTKTSSLSTPQALSARADSSYITSKTLEKLSNDNTLPPSHPPNMPSPTDVGFSRLTSFLCPKPKRWSIRNQLLRFYC
jgi:hypothetical protein